MLLVIAGPSGSGKSSIRQRLLELFPNLWYSVSYTTRAPREGEIDGVHYHFVDRAEFDRVKEADGFLEWFEVHGDMKGTPKAPIQERLDAGQDALLELDVKGALAVKEIFPDAVTIMIRPPSRDEQRRRIEERGADSPDAVERRLKDAEWEEQQSHRFDVVVLNDDLDRATDEVASLLK